MISRWRLVRDWAGFWLFLTGAIAAGGLLVKLVWWRFLDQLP